MRFSEWLNEVYMQGQGVVQQNEFMGLQQKPQDWVYFGINVLGGILRKHLEETPDEPVMLSFDKDILPYCGTIQSADSVDRAVVVKMPTKKGRTHGLNPVRRGNLKDKNVLKINVRKLEDISSALTPPSSNGQQLWLHLNNPHQQGLARYIQKLGKNIQIRTGPLPPSTPEDIAKRFNAIPVSSPQEKPNNLQDLFRKEPKPPDQPNANAIFAPEKPKTPLGNYLQRRSMNIFAPTTSGPLTDVRSRRQKPQNVLDLAWKYYPV